MKGKNETRIARKKMIFGFYPIEFFLPSFLGF